jgi:hypothetical protein
MTIDDKRLERGELTEAEFALLERAVERKRRLDEQKRSAFEYISLGLADKSAEVPPGYVTVDYKVGACEYRSIMKEELAVRLGLLRPTIPVDGIPHPVFG